MNSLSIAGLIAASVFGLIAIFLLLRSGRPFRTLLFHWFVSGWAFALLRLTGFYTGLYLPINTAVMAVTAVLGLPGIGLLLMLKFFVFV